LRETILGVCAITHGFQAVNRCTAAPDSFPARRAIVSKQVKRFLDDPALLDYIAAHRGRRAGRDTPERGP
jgi:hypothetical protein